MQSQANQKFIYLQQPLRAVNSHICVCVPSNCTVFPVLIMLLRALLLSSLSYLVPPGNGILYYSILFRPTKRCTKNFTNTLSFDAYNNRGQALLHQLKSRNQRFTEATKQTSHRRGPGGWSPDVAVFLVISHAVPATEAASLRSCVRSLIQ